MSPTFKPLAVKRRQAAAMVGFGTTKLDQLISTGEIEARKSGKNLLVIVSSLEAYLDRCPRAELKPPRRASEAMNATSSSDNETADG